LHATALNLQGNQNFYLTHFAISCKTEESWRSWGKQT